MHQNVIAQKIQKFSGEAAVTSPWGGQDTPSHTPLLKCSHYN